MAAHRRAEIFALPAGRWRVTRMRTIRFPFTCPIGAGSPQLICAFLVLFCGYLEIRVQLRFKDLFFGFAAANGIRTDERPP